MFGKTSNLVQVVVQNCIGTKRSCAMTYANARRLLSAIWVATIVTCLPGAYAAESGLVGHWKLQGDCRDYSGRGNDGVNHGVDLNTGRFDGQHAYVEIPQSKSLKFGTGDF